MYGGGGQDIFYDILTMFEVDNSAEDAYTDDFEIARSGLQQLRKHISEQDETFRQNAEEFYSCLAKAGMDREKFIEVLDCLINGMYCSNSRGEQSGLSSVFRFLRSN